MPKGSARLGAVLVLAAALVYTIYEVSLAATNLPALIGTSAFAGVSSYGQLSAMQFVEFVFTFYLGPLVLYYGAYEVAADYRPKWAAFVTGAGLFFSGFLPWVVFAYDPFGLVLDLGYVLGVVGLLFLAREHA